MLMKKKMDTEKQIKDLKVNEFVALSKVYTDKEFPYNSVTINDVCKELNVSRPTGLRILRALTEKGLLYEVKDFLTFYYPVQDKIFASQIRREIFRRIGIF